LEVQMDSNLSRLTDLALMSLVIVISVACAIGALLTLMTVAKAL
jgi:hypothetical protein